MMQVAHKAAAVSACGKVLLCGGYLVLDRNYSGLVFGLDARIYVLVKADEQEGSGGGDPKCFKSIITVTSPQFRDATWRYLCVEGPIGIDVVQQDISSSPPNPFIETALRYTLIYLSATSSVLTSNISVTILADDDYYSHGPEKLPSQINRRGRFLNFNLPLHEAHKTGLGSSAALVTAFVGAFLLYRASDKGTYFGKPDNKRRVHNLAQAAHCAAQGKVGSGFDVAAAVYGSCLYRRFSPSTLEKLGDSASPGFRERLASTIDDVGTDSAWDMAIERSAASLPKGLRLVMCDVDCGSATPGMVKRVLAWRESKPAEAEALWKSIQSQTDQLMAALTSRREENAPSYDDLRDVLLRTRHLIRSLSAETGVAIEPPSQTALLDACSTIAGVIGGVVPGAGGHDAITLLIDDGPTAIASLRQLLKDWKFDGTGEASVARGSVNLLGVREDATGLKAELDGIFNF